MKDKLFTPCGELAAVYRIQVMESKEGVASAVVTDRMMELWGITKEQLHQDAVAAETARSPVCFYSMEDMMDEIMFSPKPENLFERTEPLDAATISRDNKAWAKTIPVYENPDGFGQNRNVGFQRSEGTRSRHHRWRSQGFGDMSPTSILEGFTATGNPLKYAILRKIALLAIL